MGIGACWMLALFVMNGCMSQSKKPPAITKKPPPSIHTVEIRQMAFVPEEIIVNKGDRIVFINHDLMMHDITEASNRLWHSSPLRNGESWTFTAEKTARYFCSIHPVMKGSITVK
jgi:plastocyanin